MAPRGDMREVGAALRSCAWAAKAAAKRGGTRLRRATQGWLWRSRESARGEACWGRPGRPRQGGESRR
eukprot:7670886-Pyramimonas_sp.AAC.1